MTDTTLVEGSKPLVAVTRVILWAFLVLAVIVGLASLIGGSIAVGQQLAGGHTQLTLVADKPLPAAQTHAGALFLQGLYATASVSVHGLSAGVVALATAAAIATVLIQVSLSALIALLAWRLLRGGLFRRSIARAISAAGLVVATGGMISQVGTGLAAGAAASELNGGGNGFWPLAGRFDPTLVVFGIVLLLVGLAFEYGTRLQKDSDGLV
ncbi:MAG: hypothetical protein QOH69_2833 [Actinomycetota bacterium]|nr:hypothetical protein [Actinomycetota bacterium]